MNPARWPRPQPLDERLLLVDVPRAAVEETKVGALPSLLQPGDLLVVNDAATLPASLRTRAPRGEVRLAGVDVEGRFRAVLFDDGDWRTPTEKRAAPAIASRLIFDETLAAEVEPIDGAPSPRLVRLRFSVEGAALWRALYRLGRPVQYAYLDGPLELWHTQTAYAGRPWAVEQPSAGRPLTLGLIDELRARGVDVATLTHAAGLSSTGDAALDASLPWPERYEVPRATMHAVERAKRVVAVGTTVVRALETVAHGGPLAGTTDLVIDAHHRLRAVDALYTGMHEPGTSHFRLLEAFAPRPLLERAFVEAEARGFLQHEFGDSMLIVRQ